MPVPSSRALRALRVPALLVAIALAGTAAAPGHLSPSSDRHRVVVGDTLSELAVHYGTTVAALQSLNGLASDRILLGQLLLLPGAQEEATTAAAAPAAPTTTSYTVVVGDTLTGIAARAGTTMAAVRALNPLPADGTVVLGQRLRLPAPPAPPAPASSDAATLTTGEGPLAPVSPRYTAAVARSRTLLAAEPVTPRGTASDLLRAEALRQGVDPSLALAVAYQESGFLHALVSRTDAVGVMQLMPGTADWVGPALVGRRIDRYDVRDNVIGGVALLRALLRVTDTSSAVASYYQGLARTQRGVLLADTRLYVASVLALRDRFR